MPKRTPKLATRPTFESPFLDEWARWLPPVLWDLCDYRHDAGPGDVLVYLAELESPEHPNELFEAKERLLKAINRRLVEADSFAAILVEAARRGQQ